MRRGTGPRPGAVALAVTLAVALLAPAVATAQEAAPTDLLLTEVVVTPTAGEFIEIHNAGDTTIALDDVYLTDATFAGGSTYYYNIVTGANAGGGGFGDFHARFPAGSSIAPGEYQTVAMDGAAYTTTYGVDADYELYDTTTAAADMRAALRGSINGQGGLTNGGEVVVLYTWDGQSDLVADLDYAVWGDRDEAVDKTGVAVDGPDADSEASTYADDTAIAAQAVVSAGAHDGGDSFQRADLTEGDEVQSGGNGTAGSDETSENLSDTWCIAVVTPGAAGACDDGGTPPAVVLIHEIQGSGDGTPIPGVDVRFQAVVTSLFESRDTLDGFFVQEEDLQVDGDASTSEGVFVFCRGICPADLAVGDLVTVTGEAGEFFGMTQVSPASADDIVIDESGLDLPTATEITLPAAGSTEAEATFESTEGMVVTFPGTLAVSEYFELARYGQLVLTADQRPYQFTHDNAPSVEGFAAFNAYLETRRIILDDDDNDQNDAIFGPAADEPYPYPTTSWPQPGLSVDNTVRGGDTVDGLTGVMHWSFAGQRGTDAWRIRPIDGYDYSFDRVNERTAQPADVGGSLTVASFNVLNYFTTIDDGTNTCPAGCRGADSPAEFERQQAKIVAALAEIDADVVGLIEIENNDTAVADLAAAVNAVVGAGTYLPIETGMIGTDSIKVGYLYKAATVEPVGDYAILDSSVDQDFIDTKNRPALAQTFREVATTGTFTAAVNHLKSKGSGCDDVGEDESIIDGQASCSETRTAAAEALADWLATDPTGSGDGDALIIGDLNAYRMEDPIVVLEKAGYTDLNEAVTGDDAYTYVFDGQLGYLDYALSNPSLTEQVTGVTQWHINADEVPVLDYNDHVRDATEAPFERESGALDIYDPDPYRSSDHDPVVVGLDLVPSDVTPPELSVSVTPDMLLKPNHKYVTVTATVEATDDLDDDVEVELVSVTSDEPDNGEDDGNTVNDIVIVSDTEFRLRAERSGSGDGRTYTITYRATDDAGNTTTATATVEVPLAPGQVKSAR